jgi:hypothetical protein
MAMTGTETVLQDLVDILDNLEKRGQYSWVDIKTQEGCRFRITLSQNSLIIKNLHELSEDETDCKKIQSFIANRPKVVYLLPQRVEITEESKNEFKSKFVRSRYSTSKKNK